VVEFITDVGDGEVGLCGDFLVAEAGKVFEGDEGAVGFWEFGDEELEGSDGFEFSEGVFGSRERGFPFFGILFGGFEGGVAFVVAEVVEGEVADASEEPRAGVFDFVPVGVEAHEGVLDDVFCGFALAGEAVGVTQER
jgi:hypothetical protein